MVRGGLCGPAWAGRVPQMRAGWLSPEAFLHVGVFLAVTMGGAFWVTSTASAQEGINLSWDDCGSTGTAVKTFACDTNVGSHVLVVSFASATGLEQLDGVEAVLDLQTSGTALPE